eukprot:GHRR01001108.1.p1 GENE.GHRR01001108.1~~GHRR01001108.1.p1  ORF type:complete len:233 (+),score=63.54 GHRR01001108.1:429-1127(+)
MSNWKLLLIFGLIASSAVLRSAADDAPEAEAEAGEAEDDEDYQEADRAHLLVRKYFKEELGVQGRNLTVYIEIYNAGTATADDVQLKDAEVPEGFRLLDGSSEASLGKIDVGSSVQHSYVLVADRGSFGATFAPAAVTYQPEFDSMDTQTTKSSTPGIYVMTPVEQITRYALIAGSYATLGMATTPAHWRNFAIITAVVLLAVSGNSAYKGYNKTTTDRKRTKALQELQKEE